MTLPQEERRKYVRLNTLVDVAYNKHTRKPQEESSLRLSKNISKEGICLIVYEEFKKDDLLDLKIYFPNVKTPIDALARVAWVSEFSIGDSIGKRYDVGIEFIKISESDKDKIDQYVFSHFRTS
jgi:c-di-GMP-binding flagellar brake protein YcgR